MSQEERHATYQPSPRSPYLNAQQHRAQVNGFPTESVTYTTTNTVRGTTATPHGTPLTPLSVYRYSPPTASGRPFSEIPSSGTPNTTTGSESRTSTNMERLATLSSNYSSKIPYVHQPIATTTTTSPSPIVSNNTIPTSTIATTPTTTTTTNTPPVARGNLRSRTVPHSRGSTPLKPLLPGKPLSLSSPTFTTPRTYPPSPNSTTTTAKPFDASSRRQTPPQPNIATTTTTANNSKNNNSSASSSVTTFTPPLKRTWSGDGVDSQALIHKRAPSNELPVDQNRPLPRHYSVARPLSAEKEKQTADACSQVTLTGEKRLGEVFAFLDPRRRSIIVTEWERRISNKTLPPDTTTADAITAAIRVIWLHYYYNEIQRDPVEAYLWEKQIAEVHHQELWKQYPHSEYVPSMPLPPWDILFVFWYCAYRLQLCDPWRVRPSVFLKSVIRDGRCNIIRQLVAALPTNPLLDHYCVAPLGSEGWWIQQNKDLQFHLSPRKKVRWTDTLSAVELKKVYQLQFEQGETDIERIQTEFAQEDQEYKRGVQFILGDRLSDAQRCFEGVVGKNPHHYLSTAWLHYLWWHTSGQKLFPASTTHPSPSFSDFSRSYLPNSRDPMRLSVYNPPPGSTSMESLSAINRNPWTDRVRNHVVCHLVYQATQGQHGAQECDWDLLFCLVYFVGCGIIEKDAIKSIFMDALKKITNSLGSKIAALPNLPSSLATYIERRNIKPEPLDNALTNRNHVTGSQ